jgi:hypothetical protein
MTFVDEKLDAPVAVVDSIDVEESNVMKPQVTALIDEATASVLAGIDEFYIQQRIRWGEAITQGCIEQKNIYDVFDKTSNTKVMEIQEESNDLSRCCCAPNHSFFAQFFLVDEVGNRVGTPVMTMEREGCDCCGGPCPKPFIGCWACKPQCADKATLYSGDLASGGAIAGEFKGNRERTQLIGETVQPLGGGGFKPILQIMDRDDTSTENTKMFAATRGPTFFGGCSELCCDTKFGISQAKDGMEVPEIKQLSLGDYATITKRKPKSFTGALREAFTDSDLYEVDFKVSEVSPQQKANVLASMVQIDYMFFSRDNDMCAYRDDTVVITLCNCFCYGCVCPCNIYIPTKYGD